MIGIIGAMDEEITELKNSITTLEEKKIENFIFYIGILNGEQVILIKSGIGKVNAAICATLLINNFKIEKLIFTGVAGGTNPKIDVGDIVISNELIEHDFNCTSFGMKHGEIPRMDSSIFKADPELIRVAKKSALNLFDRELIFVGRIVSGDEFIADVDKINWLRKTFNSQCTEMEGAAVAHVCYLFKIPFVVIRSISDRADQSAKTDFQTFVKIAAKNSKNLIMEILKNINKTGG